MNNENNNINNTNQTDKFMPVSDINQINPSTVPNTVPATAPVVVPATEPVVQPQTTFQVPTVEPTLAPTPMTEPTQTAPVVAPPQEVSTETQTIPATVPMGQPQVVGDNTTMVNENLKKVEIKDYTPPSKAKVFLLVSFFIVLVLFIIFLPQISSMLSNPSSAINYQKQEEITTGRLICTLSTNTTSLDKEYENVFDFTDKKLKRTKFIINTRGDSTAESDLDELAEKCNNLKTETDGIDGFSVRCDYSDGKLIETQVYNLETIDNEKLDAAFTEAGGVLPTYQYDQDIDGIEKNMKASGYTCERQK